MALRDRPGFSWLARHLGRDVRAFTEVFGELRQAYIDGAMAYGFFTARKSASRPSDAWHGEASGAAPSVVTP
jgi:hypothetical protein